MAKLKWRYIGYGSFATNTDSVLVTAKKHPPRKKDPGKYYTVTVIGRLTQQVISTQKCETFKDCRDFADKIVTGLKLTTISYLE